MNSKAPFDYQVSLKNFYLNMKGNYIVMFVFVFAILINSTTGQQVLPADANKFISLGAIHLPDGSARFIEDNQGNLYLTIAGKYGIIAKVSDTGLNPLVNGYIKGATLGKNGAIWYIGQKKIHSFDPFKRNNSEDLTSLFFEDQEPKDTDSITNSFFYRDRFGTIWLSDAPFRVNSDMTNRPNLAVNSYKRLTPIPQTTDPFGNMWGLIVTDEKDNMAIAVLSPDKPDHWNVFNKSKGFPVGKWNVVVADIFGFIWVSGTDGLCYFDPRIPENGWHSFPSIQQYSGGEVALMSVSAMGHALVALKTGEIFEVDGNSADRPLIRSVNTSGLPKSKIDGLYSDRFGRIWVVSQNNLFRQDKLIQDWLSLTSMPYASHDVFGVECKGKIYIPAGAANHGLPAVSRNFDCLQIYDIKNDCWDLSPPMSINRRYSNVGLLDGKIWVIGGYEKINGKESKTHLVEIFDPVTRSWATGPDLDLPRAETVTATVANRLYVFGSNSDEMVCTLSISAGEKQWRTEPAAPYAILQTDGCVHNDKVYIMIGGVGLIM